MTHRYYYKPGLAGIRWLLMEWELSGRDEAWFNSLLGKYLARQLSLLARRQCV